MTYTLEYVNAYNQSVVFSYESGLILGSVDGLTANTINTVLSQGVNLVGGALQAQSVQPRIITCRGTILGASQNGRKRLLNVILPGVEGRLIYSGTWQIDVAPKQTPDVSRHANGATFDFVLEAPYPYWRKIKQSITSLAAIVPTFKFPWNLTKPWTFGKRIESQFVNVVNTGNVKIGFDLVFYAVTALSNPSVTKADTLEFIRINRNMAAGETIAIKSRANSLSVLSNAGGIITDAFNDLEYESTFYFLDIGDNILRYDADQNRGGLDVRIIYAVESAGAYEE